MTSALTEVRCTTLHQNLDAATEAAPNNLAVLDPAGQSITYSELATLSDALRDRLIELQVNPGDRVAFCLWKSIDSIVSIYGILKAGAVYVPLDPGAPASRNAFIVDNCDVAVLIVEVDLAKAIKEELNNRNVETIVEELADTTDASRYGIYIGASAKAFTQYPDPDELAYILYTSGSTGNPKGVMITHRNAVSFVDWCSVAFEPRSDDRISSHAPLHFDLSIHDIHVSLKHGAAIVLIREDIGKNPKRLSKLIADQRITVWYSTPSILGLMAEFGELESRDCSALRIVLFAGEVFPIKHLQAIKQFWKSPRFFNLYGPTETNVCTYLEIPKEIPPNKKTPYPIGHPCSHYQAVVMDETDSIVNPGDEGELLVSGPGVTPGYWDLPNRTAVCFYHDENGITWYRTGDVVKEGADGSYEFLGRRDRMVKKRGYRIELGEIESCLYQHESVEEVGVVAIADKESNVIIRAFLATRNNEKLSLIALKQFCAKRVPNYMIPDEFVQQKQLPRTSTDKVDYQQLMRHSR